MAFHRGSPCPWTAAHLPDSGRALGTQDLGFTCGVPRLGEVCPVGPSGSLARPLTAAVASALLTFLEFGIFGLLALLQRECVFLRRVFLVIFRCFPGRKWKQPVDATLFKPELSPSASCLPGAPASLWSAIFTFGCLAALVWFILLKRACLPSCRRGRGGAGECVGLASLLELECPLVCNSPAPKPCATAHLASPRVCTARQVVGVDCAAPPLRPPPCCGAEVGGGRIPSK